MAKGGSKFGINSKYNSLSTNSWEQEPAWEPDTTLHRSANSVQILNIPPYPQTHESARPKRKSLKWTPPQKPARVESALGYARFRLDF